MEALKRKTIDDLNKAREELLSLPKTSLKGIQIDSWYSKWEVAFTRAESVTPTLIKGNIDNYMNGFSDEVDSDIISDIRDRIVKLLDNAMSNIDSKVKTRPVLDDHISKVKNTKLATLLKELNASKDNSPNISVIAFRTILALIIIERAKLEKPDSILAKRKDISYEREIESAFDEKIFSSGEERHLKRYLKSGSKDTFDNVAHKSGNNYLIEKPEAEDAIKLLNNILPSII